MGAHVLKNVKMLQGGYDFSGFRNAMLLESEADAPETTGFGDDWRTFLGGGLKSLRFSNSGFFSAVDLDPVLDASLGLVDVFSFIPEGEAEGNIGFFANAIHSEYTRGGAVGEVMPFDVSGVGSDGLGLIRGTLMEWNTTIVGNASGTARQLTTVLATQKLYAVLHVLSAGGAVPTLDVIVESDTAEGFPSAVTRATFAQTGVVGAEFATPVAGPITPDDWWRVSWTVGGGSPDFDFVVLIGIL